MCPLDCGPDGIELGEPPIGRRLVSNAAPDPLLGVQAGLVPREIVEPEARVGPEEVVHRVALVPAGAIDVEPNRVAAQPPVELAERLEKPGPVAVRKAEDPAATEERRHPPPEVEPGAVLARGRDAKPLAGLAPPAPQTGVEGEAGLILEGDGVVRAECLEFFLAGAGTPALRWPGPGGSCNWPASAGSPGGGARAGLGGP